MAPLLLAGLTGRPDGVVCRVPPRPSGHSVPIWALARLRAVEGPGLFLFRTRWLGTTALPGEPLDGATPKSCRAQRPQSCTSVERVAHSTPARWSSASQSLVSSVRTPVSTGRRSALPTPAGRRLSSLPLATPKTMPRALASPLRVSARRLSSEPQKKSAMRTAPVREGDSRAAARPSDWSPDGSFPPASALPQALNFSPEKSDFTFSKSITTEVALDEAQPPEAATPSEALLMDVKLDQLSITLRAAATPLGDLPLIDFCKTPEASVALGSGSGPLVDLLTNTPGVNRRAVANACHEVGQVSREQEAAREPSQGRGPLCLTCAVRAETPEELGVFSLPLLTHDGQGAFPLGPSQVHRAVGCRAVGSWPQAAWSSGDQSFGVCGPGRGGVGAPFTSVASLLQLIDLASPLILLSPEADKENVESPLLKF
ncbi:hypothetical protein J1605_020534 [Eschrichtius robustus]|uniref:Uncharacterized protein n=1 Tax=Eschrichtius robustus TaxID=9764 RepID=A0AB34HL16_ESCRO|nr:hypothetical protein J1605_020534 [Eschrichtius robustus]